MNIGEARAIVLLGEQGSLVPVTLGVRATKSRRRFEFEEPCPLATQVREHVRKALVPMVTTGTTGSQKHLGGWRLSFSLPASAQLRGENLLIEGHSADLAIVLAMKSAVVGVPLEDGISATGRVNSANGQIEMVHGLCEKLALQDPAITSVLVPDWSNDATFAALYPQEFVSVRAQVKASKMRVVVVCNLVEAFAEATRRKLSPEIAPRLGKSFGEASRQTPVPDNERCPRPETSDDERQTIRRLFDDCSDARLTEIIDVPIEREFSRIIAPTKAVISMGELLGVVVTFLDELHLGFGSKVAVELEAGRLVEAAFAADGGLRGAFGSLRTGGIRSVFNRIVEQVKRERRFLYVKGRLHNVIDPLEGQKRLRLVHAILNEHEAVFPPHEESVAPEELANRIEEVVQTLTATQKQMISAFQR